MTNDDHERQIFGSHPHRIMDVFNKTASCMSSNGSISAPNSGDQDPCTSVNNCKIYLH